MIRGAQIIDGIVSNIAVFKVIPEGWVLVDKSVHMHDVLSNGSFTRPPTILTTEEQLDFLRQEDSKEIASLREETFNNLIDYLDIALNLPEPLKTNINRLKFKEKRNQV